MEAAPVTFGDSQVLLRRTTPEGAKTADGRLSRRHEACKYTMSPCGLGQYAWGDRGPAYFLHILLESADALLSLTSHYSTRNMISLAKAQLDLQRFRVK